MSNSTLPKNESAQSSFDGNNFSNNLLSDLAPLLTLFGEQVTKQFLSLSMGWADDILIAMGPLGIMTILVSTIRVSGVKQLKALIGRARESRATAELELLSSTSKEVCEMWNGHDIVRTYGASTTEQLVIRSNDSGTVSVYELSTALSYGYLVQSGGSQGLDHISDHAEEICNGPPSLTLNHCTSNLSARGLWIWVCASVLVQTGSLVLPAMIISASGRSIQGYGYSCYVAGTITTCAGLVLCSRIIERSTIEYDMIPDPHSEVPIQILTIQHRSVAGEQHFSPYVTVCPPNKPRVSVSRLVRNDSRLLPITSVVMAVIGFVCQFIGLRAVHWSATVICLSCTIIMTLIRAWVRRGLATPGKFMQLNEDFADVEISAWIEDHIQKTGNYKLSELEVPTNTDHNYDSGSSSIPTISMLSRTIFQNNYNRRKPEDVIWARVYEMQSNAKRFDKPVAECRQLFLCAELNKGSMKPELLSLTKELEKAITSIAQHINEHQSFKMGNLTELSWIIPLEMRRSGIVDLQNQTQQTSRPQVLNLYLYRRNLQCVYNGSLQSSCPILYTLMTCEMAHTKHKTFHVYRIIGNGNRSATGCDIDETFQMWMNGVLCTEPAVAAKPDYVEEPFLLFRQYGYQYSARWATIENDNPGKRRGAPDLPHVDVVLIQPYVDNVMRTIALEIFSICMLTFASKMKPLNEEKVYEGSRYPRYADDELTATRIWRHRDIDEMAALLCQVAPLLFSNEEEAQDAIVPALLYWGLLPEHDSVIEPDSGSSPQPKSTNSYSDLYIRPGSKKSKWANAIRPISTSRLKAETSNS